MISHLPILQVIIPLLAAPCCLIINSRRLVWLFACLATLAAWLISAALSYQVAAEGPISYALGGWDAPWGIEYRIDALNAWVLLIVTSIGALILLAAPLSVGREIEADRQSYFYILFLLCLSGLLGIAATGDVFNVFVFLEISSLATYALVGMGEKRRALTAAYQYLIVGTIGATFILVGIGFLYSMTGTLNMQDMAMRLPAVSSSQTVLAGLAFIVVGVCLKLALFPLHFWLPDAYAYAPSIAAAFLAASSTKVAVYLLIRFIFTVFGADYFFGSLLVAKIFIGLGLLGAFAASLTAIYQANVKRMLAYSSVAQIGYMVIGLGLGTATGLQATLLHLFNHALMKGALFLAMAAVVYRIAGSELEDIRGLGRRMPWSMGAIVAGGLSLVGVPLTVGFVSKWYLVLATFEARLWPLGILVLLGSLLTLTYVWRIVEAAYFSEPEPARAAKAHGGEAPLALLAPVWVLVLANIYFGIDTRLTVSLSETAAAYLMGGAP